MSKSPKRDQYQATLLQLMSCRPVAYWPVLARKLGGAKAAIMMSQLLYWNGDESVQKRDGWFWKGVDQMEHETGLVKSEQATARKGLTRLGVIEADRRGVPPTWWYRVNLEKLSEILISEESPLLNVEKLNRWETQPLGNSTVEKPDYQPSRNSTHKGAETQRSKDEFLDRYNESETTSETTIIDYSETSSSSVNSDQEEEGYKIVFSESEISDLRAIGLFEEKLNEAARLVSEKDINEDELAAMIRAAKEKEPAPGKTAALLLYRLRNAPKRLSAEELEAMKCKSYTIPGVTA